MCTARIAAASPPSFLLSSLSPQDPWHFLSVYNASTFDPMQPSVFIPGGSHCSNMGTPSDSDPPALIAAHAEIDGFLAQFLAAA